MTEQFKKIVYLIGLCKTCADYPSSQFRKADVADILDREEKKLMEGMDTPADKMTARTAFVNTKIAEVKEFLLKETGRIPSFLDVVLDKMTDMPDGTKRDLRKLMNDLPNIALEFLEKRIAEDIFFDRAAEFLTRGMKINIIDKDKSPKKED